MVTVTATKTKTDKILALDDVRQDLQVIVDMVEEGASVLDLGCGNGDLLELLESVKHADGRGIEIDEQSIYRCVEKGLSVFHDDIDTGLSEYGDKAFDFVVLNQTLQQIKHLESALNDALRVGRRVIVGLPNFAHINTRKQIFFGGRAPVTPALPYQWYSTPNLHFCSLSDFINYCSQHQVKILQKEFLSGGKRIKAWPNLRAETGIFLISAI
jgi:methionine biosynthesis protein MetW